ncbi:MAG TPA: mandelate racemase/muconate lactonizing enzyme family protein [Conexibacter sp.]|nr:mandelate racemase/muconate lactonizing enzyme family protein [Conexibacter sp.]
MRIDRITATALRIPLRESTSFSTRRVEHRDYVLAHVRTDDGREGVGYTYAGNSGGAWLAQAIEELIAPVLVGRDALAIEENWEAVHRELLLAGRRGGLVRALSAVDIAAWDLLGQAAGLPLRTLLGGAGDRVEAYASGGYYRAGDAVENVVAEIGRYQALGFSRYKMKVGGLPLREDVARVAAAREALGPDGWLALDANNAWRSSDEALRAARAFAPHDIWWLEEPLLPDDVQGHARLTQRSPITIATGEIEATRWGFAELLRAGACDIVQPDVCVAGGVTEWNKIVHAAQAVDRPVAPHWHANLHAQLFGASANCLVVEYFALEEDVYNFERVVANPLQVDRGQLVLDDTPGIGVRFDAAALARFALPSTSTSVAGA